MVEDVEVSGGPPGLHLAPVKQTAHPVPAPGTSCTGDRSRCQYLSRCQALSRYSTCRQSPPAAGDLDESSTRERERSQIYNEEECVG